MLTVEQEQNVIVLGMMLSHERRSLAQEDRARSVLWGQMHSTPNQHISTCLE